MTVSLTPDALNKFRRTPWRFQQTIERPKASDLERFVSTIVAANVELQNGTLTIDEVVFNSVKTTELCPSGSTFAHNTSIFAGSADSVRALLFAAFWDGFDFTFVPAPKPFVFYSDHDDWITFYANTKSNLNKVIELLSSNGYKLVQNWHREF
jgi:hypothetical protein